MRKRLLALLLAGLMVFALAACADQSGTQENTDDPGTGETNQDNQSSEQQPSGETAGIAKEDLKVGFVHISDPSDKGYTYNHDLGTQEMVEALGLSEDQIINKYNVSEDESCETALRELVEAGCQLIFATSFGFEDYVMTVAAEYPDVQFCHATGTQAAGSGLDNVHNYFASIFEARYLAGIAAGLKTENNHLGYVGAHPFAEVISGFTAFYRGAKSVNPDVTMDVMYTGAWNDPTREAQVAQALIDRGCDVISQHCDSTAPATTAEQNGVWQVGYNADMIDAAPNASLISARIDWGIYVTYATECVLNGEPIPVDWCKGYADGAVYLSPLNTAIAAEGTQEAIDAAAQEIIDGTRHVFEGPLTGVGQDFSGNEITLDIPEGEYYHESEEQSAPSFCYIIPGINIVE